jgi:hypothetical protein
MILFGEGSLRKAIHEFIEHYRHERNHQGLGNRLIVEEEPRADKTGAIQCRQGLGGMLSYYFTIVRRLEGTGKEFRTTEAIRRQRPQSRQRVALVGPV